MLSGNGCLAGAISAGQAHEWMQVGGVNKSGGTLSIRRSKAEGNGGWGGVQLSALLDIRPQASPGAWLIPNMLCRAAGGINSQSMVHSDGSLSISGCKAKDGGEGSQV